MRKQKYELYYYRSENSRTELDFLIRIKDNIVPIEVKANKGIARSLQTIIQDKNIPLIQYGIKYSNNNIGAENNIITLPFFTLFLLKRALNKVNNTKLEEYINSTRKQ